MTLGSLFDGIGGFPLSGQMCGIEPVWASEIEPFPCRVTAARFPRMLQLGSVTEIDGAQIPPVDIVTFGSPCQDLSIAGKQAGIHDGARSSLFFEAIRIIKEMREHDRAAGRPDEFCRPRFAVWENVPGAFSSGKGADFRAVLEALAGVREDGVSVPQPQKWDKAGCVVGDGWSIAWRVYDAQYWGVPQRRKRIYLVADFGSECAGEILFERESMSGHPQPRQAARQGTADDTAGSTGGSDRVECMNLWDSQSIRQYAADGVYPSLNANSHGGQNRSGVVYVLQANTIDRPAVVYDARGNGDGETVPTLTGDHQNRVTDYTSVCVMAHGQSNAEITQDMSPTLNCNHEQPIVAMEGSYKGRGQIAENISPALKAAHPSDIAYGVDCRNAVLDEEKTHTLQAKANGGQSLNCTPSVITNGKTPRRYIVRRLTPLECLRLQGYPDWWFDGVEGSDSAKYKACGNSLAIPCSADVLRRIAREVGT